jgi:ATP-dependent protease Clp ATPase subunit
MYDIPDRGDVEKIIIDDTVIDEGKKPKLVTSDAPKKKEPKSKEVVKTA